MNTHYLSFKGMSIELYADRNMINIMTKNNSKNYNKLNKKLVTERSKLACVCESIMPQNLSYHSLKWLLEKIELKKNYKNKYYI